VDVAPLGRDALELLAQLAHEDVDRAVAVDHRVAPHALVDRLAREHLALGVGEQLDQLELAPGEVGGDALGEGLELVGPDLDLADRDRRVVHARLGALAAAHDGLDAGDQLLGVAGLGDPVVGAESQPAHALRDARLARADDHAEVREPLAELLEVGPGLRAEDREIDDHGVEPHGHHRVERHGGGQDAVLPARVLQPLAEHLQEAGVGVENGQADRGLTSGAGAPLPFRGVARRHVCIRIRRSDGGVTPGPASGNTLVTSA
jgi:hypothetical protein